MGTDDENKRKQEEIQRKLLEEQLRRKQEEELRRIREQQERDKAQNTDKGKTVDERPDDD